MVYYNILMVYNTQRDTFNTLDSQRMAVQSKVLKKLEKLWPTRESYTMKQVMMGLVYIDKNKQQKHETRMLD